MMMQLQILFEQLIELLQKYITEDDFLMAERVANLIAKECKKQQPKVL